MNFSDALALVKEGVLLTRLAWSRSDKYIFLVGGSTFRVNRKPLNEIFKEGVEIVYKSHIDICYGGNVVGVWSPTLEDILAEDWEPADYTKI